MLAIGLTGGIGSGKTTVSKLLAQLGARILDADKIAHSTYVPGAPAYSDIVATFGEGVLAPDRTIDRKKLGPIVFANPDTLKKLNAIVHPRTFDRMRELIAEARARGEKTPLIIEAAILIEANWQPLFDEIWLVTASREQVVRRVELERGLKPEQTEARIKAQLSDQERRRHATLVIENNGALEELAHKVEELWQGALTRTRQ